MYECCLRKGYFPAFWKSNSWSYRTIFLLSCHGPGKDYSPATGGGKIPSCRGSSMASKSVPNDPLMHVKNFTVRCVNRFLLAIFIDFKGDKLLNELSSVVECVAYANGVLICELLDPYMWAWGTALRLSSSGVEGVGGIRPDSEMALAANRTGDYPVL